MTEDEFDHILYVNISIEVFELVKKHKKNKKELKSALEVFFKLLDKPSYEWTDLEREALN